MWKLGVCTHCGAMFHEVYVVLTWVNETKMFANGCPVCKRSGEFKIVGELSDARTDQ